jgi:hypothetical protein
MGAGSAGRRQRNCRYRSAKRPVRDIEQMLVVREEQNLGLLREFVQDPEARCRALVIEVDEQIICDERHRFGMVEVVLDRRDPKREI